MSSHPSPPPSGRALLPLLLPLLLSSLGVAEGASFREHRPRGGEPEPPGGPSHRGPDQDMLKALRHIEGLRHRTGGAPALRLQKPPHTAGYDNGGLPDEAPALRAMLTLGAPGRGGGEEEEWEAEDNHDQGDKTQEWFQAVLRALEQTGPAHTGPRSAGGPGGGLRLGQRAAASREATRMMFEDEDGEEGGDEEGGDEEGTDEEETAEEEEGEDEEGEGGERGLPFVRRTGEGVGEKYTPQKLATLQSIFDEVERMERRAYGGGGREEEEEEEEGEGEEGQKKEELSARSLAYDDGAGGQVDWAPLRRGEEEEEEGDDEEEEQRGDRPPADRLLDYSDDGEDEDDGVQEEENEEQDGEGLSAKRSAEARPAEEADDMANLVDYYLLKVLEKTEEEDKRELEEEEEEEEEEKERAERKVSQFQYWDNRTPQQDMHRLLRLSQKYQIPPEQLLAALQAGDRSAARSRAKPSQSGGSARTHNANTMTQKQPGLGPKQHSRYRAPERQSGHKPTDARTQEMLTLLGLGGQRPAPLERPPQYRVSPPRLQPQPRRQEKHPPSQPRGAPTKLKENFDDGVGEDQLAAFLAAKILAQYPAPTYNRQTGLKRSASGSAWRDEDEQRAVQDYFDQMDSDTRQQRGRSEAEEDAGQTQTTDDDALMKIMTFLNPESQTSREK